MEILHLIRAQELKREGERLGRAGIHQRIDLAVNEFNGRKTYEQAMLLVGRLKAIAQMANSDKFFAEKVGVGFMKEFREYQDRTIHLY